MVPVTEKGVVPFTFPEFRKNEAGEDVRQKAFGVVHIKRPTIVQRFEYIEKAGFNFTDTGEVETNGSRLTALVRLAGLAVPHLIHIDLKTEDGDDVKDSDEFLTNPDCQEICLKMAELILKGFKPSKN